MDRSQGHVGNLQEKTLPQLQEMLDRQEKLLTKQKFLESLPDKGEKVKNFATTLRQLIAERQASELSLQDSNRRSSAPTTSKEKVSDFAQLRDRSGGSVSLMQDAPVSVLKALSQPRGRLTVETAESVLAEGDNQSRDAATALAESLQGIIMSDDQPQSTQSDGSPTEAKGEALFPNTYEVVMRCSAQSGGKKPAFKPNSTLKVSSVKDLPEEFQHKMKMEQSEHVASLDGEKSSTSHAKLPEESAVHPPEYHFQKAKMISVEDSIELQRKQRQELELIQAQHAAERLAERLHIRMDEYNTTTADMEYRTNESAMYDSDDDPDPGDAVD